MPDTDADTYVYAMMIAWQKEGQDPALLIDAMSRFLTDIHSKITETPKG